MSEALEALYAGEEDRARELLRPDNELTIFEAAAFGRVDRLRSLVSEDPASARRISDDGFSALHLAIFGHQEEAGLRFEGELRPGDAARDRGLCSVGRSRSDTA
jgi:hypothetical protein